MLGKALLLAILTAAFLIHPLPAAADETQSMMNGAPNADATLRDKNGNAGPTVEGADPGMVKSTPKHDKSMVEKPPQALDARGRSLTRSAEWSLLPAIGK